MAFHHIRLPTEIDEVSAGGQAFEVAIFDQDRFGSGVAERRSYLWSRNGPLPAAWRGELFTRGAIIPHRSGPMCEQGKTQNSRNAGELVGLASGGIPSETWSNGQSRT